MWQHTSDIKRHACNGCVFLFIYVAVAMDAGAGAGDERLYYCCSTGFECSNSLWKCSEFGGGAVVHVYIFWFIFKKFFSDIVNMVGPVHLSLIMPVVGGNDTCLG